jgi:hypothetical protein
MAQYFLEANADDKADWTEVPAGSAFDRLNDGTRQPTAPATGSDYVESSTLDQICRVNMTISTRLARWSSACSPPVRAPFARS